MWKELKTDIYIDLKKTLFSGQLFHFKEIDENIFVGNAYDILTILKQENNTVYFFETDKENESILYRLFNLDINLPDHLKSDGLRFVTNEIYSAIFSFICSSNNNLKRITKMVHFLYSQGDRFDLKLSDKRLMELLKNEKIHKFPSLQKLASLESILIENKFGYRSRYITDAAIFLMNNNINWYSLAPNKARETLMQIKGIGRKVADCICLTSLKCFHIVPLDTHLARYSFSEFNMASKPITDKTYKLIQEMWIEKYGEYAGIKQLYVFKNSLDMQPGRKKSKIEI